MNTLKVEIINPKAEKILKDLAALNLISISKKESKTDFKKLISKIRSRNSSLPTLAEITKEVEIVRAERYARKRK